MEFEKGNGMVKPELLEERIFNSITWVGLLEYGALGTIYLIAGIGTLNMTGDFPMGIGAGPSRLKRMSCQRLLFIRIISGLFILILYPRVLSI